MRAAAFMSLATNAVLVEVNSGSGETTNAWPIAGVPDVTFFNPTTGLVHVAIGKPGAVNAALLAVAILANSRPALREKLHEFRETQDKKIRAIKLT